MEEDTLESTTDAKQKCEQNKSQLESLKEIMLKNKQSLEKKEEELQEYARRLSKIKSRAKMSRRSKEGSLPLKDASHALEMAVTEASEESIDGISQVKTAKARSTLLQRKLAENRKAFEQRNKEISETKRAVEEKVEAIRQQLEEQDVATMGAHQKQLSITPIKPLMIVSDIMSTMQIEGNQEKEIKIAELSNKILELEATIVDLQENLKEKDSVIESKTKAVTLMSADLSKKGKTTLDTLEDTKDEMRSMQEHFVLLESTLKNKNESLLTQLQERDYKISELEDLVQRCQKEMDDKVLSESASATFSRSTMDTLVETKEAMKSMQENFVLIETSLKDKNANLLHQLKDYELKLAEANERIFKLESGVGIVRDPAVEDLQFKLEKIEHSNKQLQDERFELQKNVTDLQDKIINISTHGNGAIIEKDNRIMELENLVEELKQSNKLLEEESKAELQKQVIDLTIRNEEYLNKITDLESMVHKLEEQKNDMAAKLPEDNAKDDEKVIKLSKELEDLNKSMIKIKAQHKNKLKNLQKQLENFKKVSDANTELVRLGNQVALLEEEKGNLQLSLVDFDELKASAGDWQERVVDLESKVSAQTKEIEMQIEAIATLENQKLDLIQELHTVKQEISTLEAENAESENLRVTAEMKVVDLEERLEVMERLQKESKRDSFLETNHTQFIKQIEALTQENNELYNRISKLEEKGTSDTGSTESFEAIQDLDKADLLKKIEDLTQRNNELTNRLRKRDEEQTASTELINEDDKNELLKKIEQLTQETANLTMKLNRLEEKGSSDTGSTESFERIPEQNESLAKIEQVETVDSEVDSKLRIDTLLQDNENQSIELEKLKTQVTELVEKNNMLQKEIKVLSAGKTDLPEDSLKQTHETSLLEKSQEENSETLQFDDPLSTKTESMILNSFKEELDHCKKVIAEQTGLLKEMKAKLENKAEELEQKCKDLIKCEASGKHKIENLENQLRDMSQNIEEWISKYKNLEHEMGEVEAAKGSIENKFRMLQMENEELLKEKQEVNALREELQSNTFKFESKLQEQLMIISEKEDEIISLKEIVEERSQELHGKYTELQNKMIAIDALQDEVNNCQSLIQEKDDLLSSISEETSKLNETIKNKEEEIYALRKDITELNRKLEESKPLKDYNYVLELLENKEILIDELQYRINATIKENDNLSEKVKNLSQQNNDIFHRLDAKQLELTELTTIRDRLETQLAEANKDKNEAEKRLWELQITIDNNTKFADDLRSELQSSYKGMEQLKMKHTEDMVLQNQRLENLIEELNGKMQECEMLKNELAEKDALLAKNMTEEVKVSLEAKVSELQEKLVGSEEKIHMQLEKMKKIAANLKKKTAVCQDLENRVVELEEKWMTEKDEKEAKNKQIQDVEIVMREKDNRIVYLEEKLAQARNEIVESTRNIEQLENDLTSSKEKILLFTRRLDEMSEEVTKLRAELVSNTAKLQAEEQSRENILSEYESYKKQVMEDNERKETELEEMKEKARELSVRMVVMETEYLEQLTSINDLKAENGLLLSKQAQINERLENVEKENEERKVLIEQLEKAAILTSSVSTLTETTQTGDEDVSTEDGSKFTATLYTHCEQCQTLVQALEAKLQEREAEIENLDNELANSIGNFVQMHESMRYKDLMAEEPYNELLSKYNSLLTNHEAVNAKLEEALKENKELEGRINELQSSNNTLEEKIVALEKLEDIQLLNKELIEKCEVRERELLNLQQEMQAVQLQLNSQIIGRKSVQVEKEEVEKQFDSTKAILEEEIKFLKIENEANERTMADLKMEIELYKNQIAVFTDKTSTITEKTSVTDDITPQLFDASKIFGIPSTSNSNSISQSEVKHLRKLLEEKELECTNLTQTTNHLQKHMAEERTHLSQNCSEHIRQLETTQQQLRAVQANLDRLEEVLIAKDKQIDSLNIKLHNVTVELMDQQNDTSKNNLVEQLKINLDELRSRLNETIGEREEQKILIDTYKSQVENLEAELKSFSDSDIVSDLENKVSSLTKERDLLQLQVTDLSRSLEELKERITREREEAKELATNFTEALNDACKKSNKRLVPPEKLTESIQQQVSLDVNAIWSTGSTEKLNIDEEEGWLWNAEDNQLAEAQEATPALVSDVEMQLRVKINDLQDQIKDVEKEKEKMLEDNKVAQLRNAKMIKKLKEYKVQVENLQQQLKVQKTAGDFYELDSAIEEELKSQITKLEKALEEIKAERKTIVAEKEALTKRLDVVVSANERYLELKEKQDMEMEVLRIRNKELSDKTESLDRQLQEFALEKGDEIEENEKEHRRKRSVDQEVFETLSKKYKDELEVLKDEMETLATENEQLQQILGEQKTKLSKLESKRTVEENESIEIVDDLNRKISELQGMLSKSREEYDLLRKQYEQSLMDANDQVAAMRQNTDFLKEESFEKINKLETEVSSLRQQIEALERNSSELQNNLRDTLQEKLSLEERFNTLTVSNEMQISSANVSMAEITDLLNTRIQEVATLKQELQRQYVEQEEIKSGLQDTIHMLNQELVEKKQEVQNLTKALGDNEKEIIQQQSVETLSALVNQTTQEIVQNHAIEIQKKENEICSLKKELELSTQSLLEKQSIVESINENITITNEKLIEKESEVIETQKRLQKLLAENESYVETIQELRKRLNESEAHIHSLEQETEDVKIVLKEKKSSRDQYEDEAAQHQNEIETIKTELLRKEEQINALNLELEETRGALCEARQSLNAKQAELESSFNIQDKSSSNIVDGLPLFRMGDDDKNLQQTIDMMQGELQMKQTELEHLKYILDNNTYPSMIQEMQERINCLYNERSELEAALRMADELAGQKEKEIDALKQKIDVQDLELISSKDVNHSFRDRRSTELQEQIVSLQNKLYAKEQEINELKYIVAEKDSQLSFQASMEPQSDDFELRETLQRLTTDLYGREQEIEHLKTNIVHLQNEVARLQAFERLSEETRNAVEKLYVEKEQVRVHAEEFLEEKLKEKSIEIDEIKGRLSMENQRILDELRLRDKDVENLRRQLNQFKMSEEKVQDELREKNDEFLRVSSILAEKERRLAELSITKDTELHNLKVQIREKEARIEELLALSDEEEKQLNELKNTLEARETEINSLKTLLEDKVKEYELLQNVLKKNISVIDSVASISGETSSEENKPSTSQELDLALYMLHQRDVRCEELTQELMQLLEERDTLQLRLSNAIRVNEELRKIGGNAPTNSDIDSKKEGFTSDRAEPVAEQSDSSKSDGPVEIAKEAIDSPLGEDKKSLALKLSQLHTMSYAKDVRLRDERELRHTQQMSLLAHKDVLSTLPPEAAAKLVNANYTLSRDVQSQSSVLLNWLWGKSTPKVVHM